MELLELMEKWRAAKLNLESPPSVSVILGQNASGTIFIDDNWGPPIPYPSIDHLDGTLNHGYVHLKSNPGLISQIPELTGFPELEAFVRTVNSETSKIESVGCEKCYSQVQDHELIRTQLGSYTDIIFTDPVKNEQVENIIELAAHLFNAVEGCEKWWSTVELGLQRLKGLHGASAPWGLLVRVMGFGRDQEEARKHWAYTLGLMGDAVAKF